MTLWIVFAVLCLAALAFVVWPLYRHTGRLTGLLAAVIALSVAISAGLYYRIGSPGVSSGPGATPDVGEMVETLADRLEEDPDDVNGWLMLGRSYQTLQRYDEAVDAFEKAMALENGQNAQTLVELGITLMGRDGGQVSDRAASLFENALALEPNNPNALFYGGAAAARRGNTELAADRWELLLGLNAPPEVRDLLRGKINEWRGQPAAISQGAAESRSVSINLSLSVEALSALPDDATVYIIARDPGQPSPPIAVTPRRLTELPASVELSDRDAMVPGRLLSAFTEVEIVARVSVSGNPMAQSGDWSGSTIVDLGTTDSIDLVIDEIVP